MQLSTFAILACALCGFACTKAQPVNSEREPLSGEAKPVKDSDSARSDTPAAKGDAPAARGGAKTAKGLFSAPNSSFETYLKGFTQGALPSKMPLPEVDIQAAKKRPMAREHYDRYLCGTGFFDCKLDEQRNEFFYGQRVDVSRDAVALLYYGIGDTDVQWVLMTYDRQGKPLAGMILAGDFGDMEWGFDGEVRADWTIARNRYVWVDGKEKEYVKDRSYQVTSSGLIEERI